MRAVYSVCKIIAEGCHSARIRKITEYSSHKTAFRVCGRRPFCQHDSMAEFRRNLGKLLAEARICRQVTEGFFVPLPVYVCLVVSTQQPFATPSMHVMLCYQHFSMECWGRILHAGSGWNPAYSLNVVVKSIMQGDMVPCVLHEPQLACRMLSGRL